MTSGTTSVLIHHTDRGCQHYRMLVGDRVQDGDDHRCHYLDSTQDNRAGGSWPCVFYFIRRSTIS
jgi:hypothetical protein